MKSIILNMNTTKSLIGLNPNDRKYLNLVNSSATVSLLTFNPFAPATPFTCAAIADYPLTNLRNFYSITKETRTTIVASGAGSNRIGGISISLPANSFLYPGQETFNTVYINLNKLNKTYLQRFRSANITEFNNYYYFVTFRKKTTPTVVERYFYAPMMHVGVNIQGPSFAENTDYRFNLFEGNILIDQGLIKYAFGVDSLPTDQYIIDVGIRGSNSLVYTDFSVSNVFIGNAVDFYINEGFQFERKNLSKFDLSPRIGKTFLEKNESVKYVKNKFEILDSTETIEISSRIFLDNKDTPIAFFPYCDTISDNTLQSEQELNMEYGGMYFISSDYGVTNTNFDVYDIDLDLTEYK